MRKMIDRRMQAAGKKVMKPEDFSEIQVRVLVRARTFALTRMHACMFAPACMHMCV